MHELNEDIRDKEIRLIGDDGAQLGIMSSADALRIADEKGLDLVKISPQAVPPVCKLMNYGKFKFEQGKREKEARKNQHVVEIKEVRMSPGIDIGDLLVIHDAGAHGLAMGYNYNGKLRCAEVLLQPDGSTRLIRRAETPEDYFATIVWDD